MEKLIETFARMWIECDPNRDKSSADEPHEFADGVTRPHWHWFIPRAKASIKYLQERGVVLTDEQ